MRLPFRFERHARSAETELPANTSHWRHQFETNLQTLSTPLCLCEGLEIVAANAALASLLGRPPGRLEGGMLDRLGWETPFSEDVLLGPDASFSGMLNMPNNQQSQNTDRSTRQLNLKVTASAYVHNQHLTLLEWYDNTVLYAVMDQLGEARTMDLATGTLRMAAFIQKLQHRLDSSTADDTKGLLAQITYDFDKRTSGQLNRETSNDLMQDLAQRVTDDLGSDCLLARSDSLSLTVFTAIGDDPKEAPHILRQLRRIAVVPMASSQIAVGGVVAPRDGETVNELMSMLALTVAASRDDGEQRLFHPGLTEAAARRERLMADMSNAIESNEITPHFQPVIDSKTGRIKSFEALVRWMHPDLGFITPPDIISIAQSAGHLHKLTAHILHQTVAQMIDWPDDVTFAVNVTPSQLTGDLVDLVRQTIRQANFDPERLEIEVTEDALIEDFESSAAIFTRLRAIGVSVAMDDFGAGYTSIGNLRLLDFTKIKIDKSIADGLPSDRRSVAIVRSLMVMARELSVAITVEGIETNEQLDFLRAFDCGVQGYVFSRPVSAADLPELRKFLQAPKPADRTAKGQTVVPLASHQQRPGRKPAG